MTLDVLVSTIGREGIGRVAAMKMPRVDGVGYIVSWQMPVGEVPESLASRTDVTVVTLHERGLSRNRNNAIDHSRADIYLIADDDVDYTPEGLEAVVKAFERHPSMAVATFIYDGNDGKCYPSAETDISGRLPRGYYVSSIEMAVRRCEATAPLRFDTRFGLGAPRFQIGEEELFHFVARRRGLNCRFFPTVVAFHRGASTGVRMLRCREVLQGFGAVIANLYPATSFLRVPLKAWRVWRSGGSLPRALYYITKGALMAPKIKVR